MDTILIASLIVNLYCCQGYVVLHLYKFFQWIFYKLSKQEKIIHPDKKCRRLISWILDAIITQITGWFSLAILVSTVIYIPFQIPDANTLEWTRVLIAIFIGKHVFKCFNELLVSLNITYGIYHAILFCSSISLLHPGTNAFLALLVIFVEVADLPLLVRRVFMEHQIPQYQRGHVWIAWLALVCVVAVRGVFVVIALCLALVRRSPLNLCHADLSAFCFLMSFIIIANIWIIMYSIMRVQKVTMIHKLYEITSSKLYSQTEMEKNNDYLAEVKDIETSDDQHQFYKNIILVAKDAYKTFLKPKYISENSRTNNIAMTNIVQACNNNIFTPPNNQTIDHV